MNAKILIFLLVMLVIAADAHAIGISPSRTILNFTPNAEFQLEVSVINRENRTLPVRLYVRGDLAQFVQFPDSSVTIKPESYVTFSYVLKMPPSLAGPETYDTRIGAVEVPAGGGMVGAVAGVEAQLWVVAPTGTGWSPPLGGNQSSSQQPGNQSGQNESTPVGQPLTPETEQPAALPLGGIMLVAIGAVLAAAALATFVSVQASPRKVRRK